MSARDEMARIILMSCPVKMKPETAVHYANNLVAAGFGPVKEAAAEALEEAAEELERRAKNVQNNTYLESGIYAELTHRADALQGAARTVRARADAVRGEG